jgi:hypothetical protein
MVIRTQEDINVAEHIVDLNARRVSLTNSVIGDIVYDAITVEYPDTTTEVFKYRSGGAGGTIQATITVTYTDTTKDDISSVVRT